MGKDKVKQIEEKPKNGSKFPGLSDDELIQVQIGTLRDGALKRKPAKFVLPARKP
jgi:hypothetical protein